MVAGEMPAEGVGPGEDEGVGNFCRLGMIGSNS